MKKYLLRFIWYKKVLCTIHTGIWYLQGNWVNVLVERTYIFWLSFISDIKYTCDTEWTKKISEKLKQI